MADKEQMDGQIVIYAPLNGTVKPLETVPIQRFQKKW